MYSELFIDSNTITIPKRNVAIIIFALNSQEVTLIIYGLSD